MAEPPLVFPDVSRAVIEAARHHLIPFGFPLTGDEGFQIPTGEHGVILGFRYEEATETLTVTIDHKGHLVPDRAIRDRIQAALDEARQEASA